jgi:hypothetical protein
MFGFSFLLLVFSDLPLPFCFLNQFFTFAGNEPDKVTADCRSKNLNVALTAGILVK